MKLSQQGLLLVSILLAMELTFVAVLLGLLQQAEMEWRKEAHAKEVVGYTNRLVQVTWSVGQSIDKVVFSHDPKAEESYMQSRAEILNALDWLKNDFKDQPNERALVEGLETPIRKALSLIDRARATLKDKPPVEALPLIKEGKNHFQGDFNGITDKVFKLLESQRKIQLESPVAQKRAREQTKTVLLIGLAGNVLIAFALALFFVRGITSRLSILVDNAERMKCRRELNAPMKGADEIAVLDLVFHDMATALRTEEELLKSSEARVRTIIENMPIGLIMIDRGGTIEFVNPMLEQITGFELGELAGKQLTKLLPAGTSTKDILEELKTKPAGHIQELMAVKKNGERFPIEFSLTHFDTAEGPRQLAVMLDITERHEIQRLRQAFVAMVSHELKTPLTAVSGFLTLLGMGAFGGLSDEALAQAERAEGNITRLMKLISDLLDLEKLESGILNVSPQPTLLNEILAETLASVKAFSQEHGVALDMPDSDQVRFEINADGDRIVQVLVNLISNAIKFSEKGSRVKVQIDRQEGCVEFKVIDTGRGIPAKYQEMIFERFQQVEASDARQKGGTGLGLAICKSIVEQHGGKIGVASEEGKGSTFWFRLPFKVEASKAAV
ncbi:MAG TPA: ATP-binding protein [Candidatus Obscuribacterales bacterium]